MFENPSTRSRAVSRLRATVPLSRDLHQKTSLQALARMSQCCGINELDDKRLAVSRVESGSSAVADERKRREIESAGLPGTSDMEADSKANSGAKPE